MDWRILTAITVLTWGAYTVLLKKAAESFRWQASMLLFVLGYSVFIAAYYLWNSGGTASTLVQKRSILPLVSGALCGVGAVTFFQALAARPGSIVLPLISLYVIVSVVGCILFLREPLTFRVALGTAFAVIAAVLLAK